MSEVESGRWLASQRRSRQRRLVAARQRVRRRISLRSGVALMCVMALGGGVALANQTSDVQRKLGVSADGVMGPQTKRAIKRFHFKRKIFLSAIREGEIERDGGSVGIGPLGTLK